MIPNTLFFLSICDRFLQLALSCFSFFSKKKEKANLTSVLELPNLFVHTTHAKQTPNLHNDLLKCMKIGNSNTVSFQPIFFLRREGKIIMSLYRFHLAVMESDYEFFFHFIGPLISLCNNYNLSL